MSKSIINKEYNRLLSDLKQQVVSSGYKAVLSVNKELILLYHHIGTAILNCQTNQGWGAKVIDLLSRDLRAEFPEMKGFSPQNLKYMRKFAEEYTTDKIGQQLVDQLPWGHLITLIYSIFAQILIVCGAHDNLKRRFLKNLGLTIASEWYVEEIITNI